MLKHTKLTYNQAKAEYDYIAGIDYRQPGDTFNNDKACFIRYCEMQAKSLARDGFTSISEDITRFITAIN